MYVDSVKRLSVAAGFAAALAVLAACATSPVEPGRSSSAVPSTTQVWPGPSPVTSTAPTALPEGVDVDQRDPDSVALTSVSIWFSWDTRSDRSPFDAALRTAPLMGQSCRDRLTGSTPMGAAGQDWTELSQVHARASVKATIASEDRPADTADRALRLVGVTQKFTADRRVPDRNLIAQVVLRKSPGGQWLLGDDQLDMCGVITR